MKTTLRITAPDGSLCWDAYSIPPALLYVLRHSLGLDRDGRGRKYRNRFCTAEGSDDFPICEELVEHELMAKLGPMGEMFGGDRVYIVTHEGKEVVELHTPAGPRLTRGQRRYRMWLCLDGSISFSDFLKSPYAGGVS